MVKPPPFTGFLGNGTIATMPPRNLPNPTVICSVARLPPLDRQTMFLTILHVTL